MALPRYSPPVTAAAAPTSASVVVVPPARVEGPDPKGSCCGWQGAVPRSTPYRCPAGGDQAADVIDVEDGRLLLGGLGEVARSKGLGTSVSAAHQEQKGRRFCQRMRIVEGSTSLSSAGRRSTGRGPGRSWPPGPA